MQEKLLFYREFAVYNTQDDPEIYNSDGENVGITLLVRLVVMTDPFNIRLAYRVVTYALG